MSGTGGRRAADLAHWSFDQTLKITKSILTEFPNKRFLKHTSSNLWRILLIWMQNILLLFFSGNVTTLLTDQWNSSIDGLVGDFYVALVIYLLYKSVTCGFKLLQAESRFKCYWKQWQQLCCQGEVCAWTGILSKPISVQNVEILYPNSKLHEYESILQISVIRRSSKRRVTM